MQKSIKINISFWIECLLTIILFILSIQNQTLLLITMCCSLLLIKQGEIGVVKLIFLYMMRYFISPGIDFEGSQLFINIMKYVLIFICGSYFLYQSSRQWATNKVMSLFVFGSCLLMTIYAITSLLTSAFPLVAILKLINYFLPLMIIVLLISQIKDFKKLIFWLAVYIELLIISSSFYINQPIGKLLNGYSFQGILNHPNLFAIIMLMGLTLILVSINYQRQFIICQLIIVAIGTYELVKTNSRTGVLSFVVCVCLYFLLMNMHKRYKWLIFGSVVMTVVIIFMNPFIQERIKAFLVKGQRSDQALYSRYIQIEYLMDALDKYPLFGGGFGIPVNNTSLDLLNFTFEAGNIFFALIIFTGIFGLICYLIYLVFMLFIVQHPFRLTIVLFISTLLVNMGEMIMFSSTNAGIFCYILWSIYLKEGMELQHESKL
ncbi:hypothetical protein BUZ67_10280 [Staphylococcus pasteuri]|uniref:O-antigen ligase family protein n=1 Tax=Staphylococcus pasteuri TaxID=45972 RepID=UPI000D33D621|nr:O-antigen ligase family protein [Staphylococcus pasteuri]PTU83446.1 hypothetical protein BUZ67_10280 [Staphylococcus pasteuri]